MQSQPYRPTVVSIGAEYIQDAYVWDRSPGEAGGLDPTTLTDLGASDDFLARLSAWNDTYARLTGTDFQWRAEQSEADWDEEGWRLSLELQRQLPGIDVHYGPPDDSRSSMRERLGIAPPPPRVQDETTTQQAEADPELVAYFTREDLPPQR